MYMNCLILNRIVVLFIAFQNAGAKLHIMNEVFLRSTQKLSVCSEILIKLYLLSGII